MHRLAELDDRRRRLLGSGLLALGLVGLGVGVLVIHFGSFPVAEPVGGVLVPVQVDYFGWIPRGKWVKALGYLTVFAASQLALAGAALLWILNQKMTWARAAFASLVAWLELMMLFGIAPNEWLNFAQTDLDWSTARVAVTIPKPLVLGNHVELSYAALKDAISMGYNVVVLGAAILFAHKIQGMRTGRPETPQMVSPYGRPVVKGGH